MSVNDVDAAGPSEAADVCGCWVVVKADPATGDIDVYGPMTALVALADAKARRRELDAEGLGEVIVAMSRLEHCTRAVAAVEATDECVRAHRTSESVRSAGSRE